METESHLVRTSRIACIHCGTSFKPSKPDEKYCCPGCEFVHALIQQNGLQRYYDLRTVAVAPVGTTVFARRTYEWLDELVQHVESKEGKTSNITLGIQGVSCIGCVWLIEKIFIQQDGAISARVDSALGKLHLRWNTGECDLVSFAKKLQSFGYLVGPPGEPPKSDALLTRMGLCAAFAMNVMLFSVPSYFGMTQTFAYAWLFDRLSLGFCTLSFLVGGTYFFRRAVQGLRSGFVHIDLPISLGLIAAYAGSLYGFSEGHRGLMFFDFVANFTFLMLVGRWLQNRVVSANRSRLLECRGPARRIRVLSAEAPGSPSSWREIDLSTLARGDEYELTTGQVNPVHAVLHSEGAEMGLEWISGESTPRLYARGQNIPAGTVNYSAQPIRFLALETYRDSNLARLMDHEVRADSTGIFIQRIIIGAIILILFIAFLGAAGWWWAGAPWNRVLQVFISILVVSCPCALGVAIPLTDELASVAARAGGVFVREGSLWRRLLRVRNIVFDKTGTLTLESIHLKNPDQLRKLKQDERTALYILVAENAHPTASGVREALLTAWPEFLEVSTPELKETPGVGVETVWENHTWSLTRPELTGNDQAQMIFRKDGHELLRLTFSEELRTDALAEIDLLRNLGWSVRIASGDRREKVAAIAQALHVAPEDWRSEMTPEEKQKWVQSIGSGETLMLGDGANDTLAFEESMVRGSPITSRGILEERADFFFVGRGMAGLRRIVEIASNRDRAIRLVVAFGVVYNILAITLCLTGWMHPLVASVLMPMSSMVAIAIVFRSQPSRLFRVD